LTLLAVNSDDLSELEKEGLIQRFEYTFDLVAIGENISFNQLLDINVQIEFYTV
jgi:hypothetical protein